VTESVFSFDGESVPARPGDTVASALYRSGTRIFSRSFKYHRPRGLLCLAGNCPNCLVNVDGVPNVRACTTPAREGMKVVHQNASPSLECDVLSAAKWVGWLMPVGFYYKTFTRPFAWKGVEPLIRRAAGLGVLPESPEVARAHDLYEHVHLKADVAVIGAGPAGMTAAAEASKAGARVVLVEEGPELGGHLRYERTGAAELPRLRDALPAAAVEVLADATCFGLYEGGLLGIVQRRRTPGAGGVRERLIHLRARTVVAATGAYETPLLFENNDLPGVMLSTAVQRLIRVHGIKPGESAAVVSARADGGPVAEDLREAGVRIAAVVPPDRVVAALGRRHVRGLRTADGRVACELVVVCGIRVPEASLIAQAGGRLEWNDEASAFLPSELPPGIFAAGRVTGVEDLRTSLSHAALAGQMAAQAASGGAPDGGLRSPAPSPAPGPSTLLGTPSGKSFVCLCEDVTARDLRHAVAEGFDQIETVKRYTTVSMGPCQGKMCQLGSIGICARETGRTIAQTGRTTSRPPTRPVSLGALGGARRHPVKRTPMHSRHEEMGCVWMDMGEWKRPLYYFKPGSAKSKKECVEEEYEAVRERAGIIDLSTLGKLDVQGKDAPRLLDRVYANRLSDLRPGRTRYGVILDEAGIILDDGTVSRLSEDRYFVTTTTGNLEFVQQWLEWWAAGTGWCVHVTNVTGAYAAVNVAGPRARDLLRKLTSIDLGTKAFPYMACAQGEVAGVPSFLMRIGFVGETGWEIHAPAEYGESLWDALLEAGREFDARAFGVEAQRLLRLEKKHVIVNVDTDATSNLFAADMAWLTKADKEDFIGKAAIERDRPRALREKLVGFVMQDDLVPDDGASLVAADGRPAGRVTSARFSPARGRAVGMAWVPAELAADGREIRVHVRGSFGRARIVQEPFYDPEGKRLKS
jgi:sarcosine oxidase subunit alpha